MDVFYVRSKAVEINMWRIFKIDETEVFKEGKLLEVSESSISLLDIIYNSF